MFYTRRRIKQPFKNIICLTSHTSNNVWFYPHLNCSPASDTANCSAPFLHQHYIHTETIWFRKIEAYSVAPFIWYKYQIIGLKPHQNLLQGIIKLFIKV